MRFLNKSTPSKAVKRTLPPYGRKTCFRKLSGTKTEQKTTQAICRTCPGELRDIVAASFFLRNAHSSPILSPRHFSVKGKPKTYGNHHPNAALRPSLFFFFPCWGTDPIRILVTVYSGGGWVVPPPPPPCLVRRPLNKSLLPKKSSCPGGPSPAPFFFFRIP